MCANICLIILLLDAFYLDYVEVVTKGKRRDKCKDNHYFSIFKKLYPNIFPFISDKRKITYFQTLWETSNI